MYEIEFLVAQLEDILPQENEECFKRVCDTLNYYLEKRGKIRQFPVSYAAQKEPDNLGHVDKLLIHSRAAAI